MPYDIMRVMNRIAPPKISRQIKAGYLFSIIRQYMPWVRKYIPLQVQKKLAAAENIGMRLSSREKTFVLNQAARVLKAAPPLKTDDHSGSGFAILAVILFAAYMAMTAISVTRNIQWVRQLIDSGLPFFLLMPVVLIWTARETEAGLLPFLQPKNLAAEIGIGILTAVPVALLPALLLDENGAGMPKGLFFFFFLAAATTAGPVMEEVLFRRVIQMPLSQKTGPLLAVLFTAGLFAAAHMPELLYDPGAMALKATQKKMAVYFACGIILSTLFHYRKNLIPCILAHSLANLMNIVILL